VPELDVADDVVDRHQHQRVGIRRRWVAAHEAREEGPVVVLALHEQVQGVAIGLHRGELHPAALVLHPLRRVHAAGAVGDGVLVGRRRVRHAQRDLVHAVPVARVVGRDLVAAHQRPGHHDADAPLLEHVRHPVAPARLQAGVGRLGEAIRAGEEMRRLRRVAHVELDVVDAVDRHAVLGGRGGDGSCCGGHR
jgi:hypothetical protein